MRVIARDRFGNILRKGDKVVYMFLRRIPGATIPGLEEGVIESILENRVKIKGEEDIVVPQRCIRFDKIDTSAPFEVALPDRQGWQYGST